MPTPSTRRTLRADDLELVSDQYGPASGHPILFLHGAGQTRAAWKNAAIAAGEAGYNATAIDLRGHGDSAWSTDGDYRLTTFAADLGDIVDQLSAHPILVGASLGGLSSLLFASQSNCVRALIMVDITPRFEEQGVAEIQAFMNAHPHGFNSVEDAAEAVKKFLPHRGNPANPSGLLKNLRRDAAGRYRWHWDPKFLNGSLQFDAHAMRDALERAARTLEIPVLLIKGERSRVVSDQGARDFLKLVPHARFVNIPGADHMIAGDQNDSFTRATLDFCRDIFQPGIKE